MGDFNTKNSSSTLLAGTFDLILNFTSGLCIVGVRKNS